MSKAIKSIMMRDYSARVKATGAGGDAFGDAVLISIRGVKAIDTTRLRQNLAKKNIRITVVRNALARKTFEGSSLEALNELLAGASALAYGSTSVVEIARALVASVAKMPALELKGAVLDGTLFKGKAGVEELSRFPTKDEAIAQIVTLAVSPGRNLLAQVQGPGSGLMGIVKAIEEKLEKGEAITAKA